MRKPNTKHHENKRNSDARHERIPDGTKYISIGEVVLKEISVSVPVELHCTND